MSEPIRAVDRALDVLLCFSPDSPELSMTQISEKVGMHKSTVHRLLATLENKHFVERDAITGLYQPGNSLLQMAFLTLGKNDLNEVAAPYMNQLHEKYRETITLSILDETDMVYIAVQESQQAVKLAAKPGQRLPAFSTASGKVTIAFSSAEIIKRIFDHGFPQLTEYTIKDPEKMHQIIQKVRERGFAYSEQEHEEGINAVAAPIFNKEKLPMAAIAVAGPAYRLPLDRMMEIGPAVLEAAKEITKELVFISKIK